MTDWDVYKRQGQVKLAGNMKQKELLEGRKLFTNIAVPGKVINLPPSLNVTENAGGFSDLP